jgi:hypothetical protein
MKQLKKKKTRWGNNSSRIVSDINDQSSDDIPNSFQSKN